MKTLLKHALRIALAIGIFVALYYLACAAWGQHRINSDFYPLDQGVVANIVAGFIQAFIIGTLIYRVWKPLRDPVNRWMHGHLAPITQHLTKSSERQKMILKQNAHIIAKTKSIPNEHEDGTDMATVPEHLL